MCSQASSRTLFVTGASAAAHPRRPGRASAEPHSRGEITWVTGGIGRDEAHAFEREAASYPLELVFVQKARRPRPVPGRRAHHHPRREAPRRVRGPHSRGRYFLARLPHGRVRGERALGGLELQPPAAQSARSTSAWSSSGTGSGPEPQRLARGEDRLGELREARRARRRRHVARQVLHEVRHLAHVRHADRVGEEREHRLVVGRIAGEDEALAFALERRRRNPRASARRVVESLS